MRLSFPPLLALFAGALVPLTFSPIDWWPLALPSVAIFYVLLQNTTPRRAAFLSWCYGFGLFGVGASWVYVSIHDFGNAPPALAGILTVLFVAGLALFTLIQGWVYRRFGSATWPVLGFAACWVLGEWFRSWFLTGFPWLYLGSAHVTTILSGVAPLFGVLGISFVLALSGALLGECWLRYRERMPIIRSGNRHSREAESRPSREAESRHSREAESRHSREGGNPVSLDVAQDSHPGHFAQLLTVPGSRLRGNDGIASLLLCLVALWTLAIVPRNLSWAEASGTLEVGLVQANIAQDLKFDPNELENNLRAYGELSQPLWGKDLVVWSETAIPALRENVMPLVTSLEELAGGTGSTLLTGIFASSDDGIHNSIVALGNGSGLWHKRKLVPFGEYTPLRSLVGGVLELFSLPMSSLVPGPREQNILEASGQVIAPFICYEVVYPDFVRQYAREADLLVTISNDTWFGRSWGPPQHLQMAAMRARENERYMVRATNNGISALISERGEIIARVPQFVATTLSGTVALMEGRTPWSRWGNWPLLILCGLLLMANFYQIRASIPTAKS